MPHEDMLVLFHEAALELQADLAEASWDGYRSPPHGPATSELHLAEDGQRRCDVRTNGVVSTGCRPCGIDMHDADALPIGGSP
jgi:hypothetical protein